MSKMGLKEIRGFPRVSSVCACVRVYVCVRVCKSVKTILLLTLSLTLLLAKLASTIPASTFLVQGPIMALGSICNSCLSFSPLQVGLALRSLFLVQHAAGQAREHLRAEPSMPSKTVLPFVAINGVIYDQSAPG